MRLTLEDAIWTLHDKPERLTAFFEIEPYLGHKQFWALFHDLITNIDMIAVHLDNICGVLTEERLSSPERIGMLSDGDLRFYNALPKKFMTIYRGCNFEQNEDGISWTRNKERAIWFARRYAAPNKEPRVLVGKVAKEDVIAAYAGRNEDEVLVLPDRVKFCRIIEVQPRKPTGFDALAFGIQCFGYSEEHEAWRYVAMAHFQEKDREKTIRNLLTLAKNLRELGFSYKPARYERVAKLMETVNVNQVPA